MENASAISFSKVSKQYHEGVPLLENVTFDLKYGELSILVGPSGSGKSTILQMASTLVSPDSGEIWIDGKQKSNVLQGTFSYVPQEDFLFESLSALENVELALEMDRKAPSNQEQVAMNALRELGIESISNRMIDKLSAGERRRVALARGLVRSPSIFIADEPTSSLDLDKTNELLRLLKDRQNKVKKMAILIASHDVLELAPFADRVYEIKNYTLVERART
ncbi:MAG: ABC transporter ATP-binding protein [Nitrososphaerales archaeon]